MSNTEEGARPPDDSAPIVTWGQLARIVLFGTALSAVLAAVASAGFLYANFSDGQTEMKKDLGRVWLSISDIQGARKVAEAQVGLALAATEKENIARDGRISALHENYLSATDAMNKLNATMAQTIQQTDSKVDSLLAQTNDLKVSVARIESAMRYLDGDGKSRDGTPHP